MILNLFYNAKVTYGSFCHSEYILYIFSFSVGSMYAVLLKEMSVMYPGDKEEKVRLT